MGCGDVTGGCGDVTGSRSGEGAADRREALLPHGVDRYAQREKPTTESWLTLQHVTGFELELTLPFARELGFTAA
eukprot:56691-Rhodomonas_salina.1